MNTKISEYKGFVCIEGGDNLIASPEMSPGSLGCVTDLAHVDISQGAYDILCTVGRGSDAIGDVDCFRAADDTIIFAWFGYKNRIIDNSDGDIIGARGYDPSLLKDRITIVETSPEFCAEVDQLIVDIEAIAR